MRDVVEDIITELRYGVIDNVISELRAAWCIYPPELRFNPNHDPSNGRFTSGGGNGSGLTSSAVSGKIKKLGLAQEKTFNVYDYDIEEDTQSVEEFQKFAAENFGITNITGISDLRNGKEAVYMLSEISELSKEHNATFSRITLMDYGDAKVAAETVGSELRLNTQYLNRPGAFKAVLDEWESTGYIPKGCNNSSYVARHEYYHLLTQSLIDEPHSNIKTVVNRAIKNGCEDISENGRKNYHEFTADLLSAKCLTKRQNVLKQRILSHIKER